MLHKMLLSWFQIYQMNSNSNISNFQLQIFQLSAQCSDIPGGASQMSTTAKLLLLFSGLSTGYDFICSLSYLWRVCGSYSSMLARAQTLLLRAVTYLNWKILWWSTPWVFFLNKTSCTPTGHAHVTHGSTTCNPRDNFPLRTPRGWPELLNFKYTPWVSLEKSSTGLLDSLRGIPRCPRGVFKAYTLWVNDGYLSVTHETCTCHPQ